MTDRARRIGNGSAAAGGALVVSAEETVVVAIDNDGDESDEAQQGVNNSASASCSHTETTATTTTTTTADHSTTVNSEDIEYIEPDFVRRVRVPEKREQQHDDDDDGASGGAARSSSNTSTASTTTNSRNKKKKPAGTPSGSSSRSSAIRSLTTARLKNDDSLATATEEVRSTSSLPDLVDQQATYDVDAAKEISDSTGKTAMSSSRDDEQDQNDAMLVEQVMVNERLEHVNYKDMGENLSFFGARSSRRAGRDVEPTSHYSNSSSNNAAPPPPSSDDPVVAVLVHDDENMMHRQRSDDYNAPIVMLTTEQPPVGVPDEENGLSEMEKQKLQAEQQQKRRQTLCLFGAVVVVLLAATATAIGIAIDNRNKARSAANERDPIFVMTNAPTVSPAPTSMPTVPALCAAVRCGSSWEEANVKCGQQCLTEPCPDGEACWADLEPVLDCCQDTKDAQDPFVNQDENAISVCSALRCGVDWADANSKCGNTCEPVKECPQGQICYHNLDPILDEISNTTMCDATSRCGTSYANANSKCGDTCSQSTCPDGESCWADLATDKLECCFPYAESLNVTVKKCTTTRCGTTWPNANNFCFDNCETDEDCTGYLQKCYADLTTDLDCCVPPTVCTSSRCGFTRYLANLNNGCNSQSCTEDDDCGIGQLCFHGLDTDMECCDVVEAVPDPYTCTNTRCGLDWSHADMTCGDNCIDDGDCMEEGHKCWADLEVKLDCCPRESVNNTDVLPEPQPEQPPQNSTAAGGDELMACTSTRCGLDWGSANSGCFDNCLTNEDCPEGLSCFADLTTTLDCCESSPDTNTTDTNKNETVIEACTVIRCGTDFNHANSTCGQNCLDNVDCPSGQLCFADVAADLDCCPEVEEKEAIVYADCTATRCGETWGAASVSCGLNCLSDADCPAGEQCFADLATTTLECCRRECTTTRCGTSWGEANTNCHENCLSNDDCSDGLLCFADLNPALDCCSTT